MTGIGVVTGALLTALLVRSTTGPMAAREIVMIIGYALAMMGVCLVACIVPTRRVLRVDPVNALRSD